MHDLTKVDVQRDIKIPMRDGVHLNATVYLPSGAGSTPVPCIAGVTPYIADHLHDRGVYFAARGLAFLAIDVRGRGNSEGEFQPWKHEGHDGHDVVEWVAGQGYCNGKVGLYGGSYLGYVQWVTAAELPPHLVMMVPTAAPYLAVDVPLRDNIFTPEEVRWQVMVSGRANQIKLFTDDAFWSEMYRRWHESGRPLCEMDALVGSPSAAFQEYLSHPEPDAYWDSLNPTAEQYARIQIPILTITGIYDGDQLGSLEHYKLHSQNATPEAQGRHYLIIGPWNHQGCATPSAEFDGLKVGPAALIDLYKLHFEWYAWILGTRPKPEFLQNNVAYYVMGAERWRYCERLEEATERTQPLYLSSETNPTDVFRSGRLALEPSVEGGPDHYVYDPTDVGHAELESSMPWMTHWSDQRLIHAAIGKHLVYHSEPFAQDTEITGFFKFVAWLSIDQPDTDFRVKIFEIDLNGASVQLTQASKRARYRENHRHATLIGTLEPLKYSFDTFTFVARLIKKGGRLRLVLGPVNSIYEEKNYNSGAGVSRESVKDARPTQVRLFHDMEHPTVLHVPLGKTENP